MSGLQDDANLGQLGEGQGEEPEELIKGLERKRKPQGLFLWAVMVISVTASLYHLYAAYFMPFFALRHRTIHWSFMGTLLFLLYPFSKRHSRRDCPSIIDFLLLGLLLLASGYLFWNSREIMGRAGLYTDLDYAVAALLVLLVLEGSRRAAGWPVPVISIVFLAYSLLGPYLPGVLLHKGYTLKRTLTYLALSTDGVYGIPLGVSAQFIFLFILFGAILEKTGAGRFFIRLALSLTGWTRGGPAKAAVVSSCLMGTISGSSVANVVTTGTFTIPLMKRMGFPPHVAGAVEAVSSTHGQFMPPIMGAAAFLMAEYIGVPYIKVAIAAAIPAVLAYFAIFMQVDLRAARLGLKGMPRRELPDIWETLKEGWHLLIPLIALVYFLVNGYSAQLAVFWTIIFIMPVSFLRKETRIGPKEFLKAFQEGAIGTVGVAAACAAAGIIIGVTTMTGLGLQFTGLVIDLSGGILYLAAPLTMVASLILGMGIPTTAMYIIVATLVAPALTKLGAPIMASHLFILYFGAIADITPPVALAAYAGAGIAGARVLPTGVAAFTTGLAAYVIPYIFLTNELLLMKGPPLGIIAFALSVAFGIVCMAAFFQGYLLEPLRAYERAFLILAAGLLFIPGWKTDLLGFALLVGILAHQWWRRRGAKPLPVEKEG